MKKEDRVRSLFRPGNLLANTEDGEWRPFLVIGAEEFIDEYSGRPHARIRWISTEGTISMWHEYSISKLAMIIDEYRLLRTIGNVP